MWTETELREDFRKKFQELIERDDTTVVQDIEDAAAYAADIAYGIQG